MKDTFTCWLDLTHIHDDLEDVECEIDLDLYNSRTNESDDPSEIEVLSVKCIGNCPALEGQYIELTQKLEDKIIDRYQDQQSNY